MTKRIYNIIGYLLLAISLPAQAAIDCSKMVPSEYFKNSFGTHLDAFLDRYLGTGLLRLLVPIGVIILLSQLMAFRRAKELDAQGRPCVRYLGFRFSMPLLAVFLFGLAISEYNDPFNHCYSGNLLLAYIPFGLAIFVCLYSVHCWNYCFVLEPHGISRLFSPFKPVRYSLDDLVAVEQPKPGITVLRFTGGRKVGIFMLLSGRKYFVEQLLKQTNMTVNRKR